MSQSLAKVYLHVVFSTKNREPLLDPNWRDELFNVLGGVANNLGLSISDCGRRSGSHPYVVPIGTDNNHFGCGWENKIDLISLGKPNARIVENISLASRICSVFGESVKCRICS
jgi:hypothetical protein